MAALHAVPVPTGITVTVTGTLLALTQPLLLVVCTKYVVVEFNAGVVNEVPDPTCVPPVAASNQVMVLPESAVANKVVDYLD